jgi:hypothetical protein
MRMYAWHKAFKIKGRWDGQVLCARRTSHGLGAWCRALAGVWYLALELRCNLLLSRQNLKPATYSITTLTGPSACPAIPASAGTFTYDDVQVALQ